jgi:signal transduction histidine kinase
VGLMLRILILLFAGLAVATSATAKPLPRSVLIVSQWDPGLPFFAALSSAFHATLHANSPEPISVYSEALDLSRFPAPKYQENFRRYLRDKYRDKDLGAIVAVGALAFEFMLRARVEVSPTAPLVFSEVDESTIAKLKLPSDVTGTTIHLALHDMVAIAQALVPKLQRVALVGEPLGDTSIYRNFKDELVQISALEFIDLTGLPLSEVKKRVAVLPENTVILYTAIFVDGAGVAFDPTLALESIAAVANRPIVHRTETQLGHGAVGGLILKPNLVGNDAARLTLRILSGESAANIPIVLGDYNKPMFDWRQLTRWNISESQLPPDSEIRFRVPGIWEQYRWYVIVALVIIAFQFTLIGWLLIERRRRRIVEAESLLRLSEVVHLNESAIAGALSASIAHELNQPLGAILSSAEAAELYLNANPPNLERVKAILSNIRRDDQHAADIISHLRGLLRKTSKTDLEVFDLIDAIKDTLHIVASEVKARGVALNTIYVPGALSVRANKIQLRQVILNLAVNGMDAMQNCVPGTGKISIETALNGESQVEVSVSDSGTGIPLDKMNKVFDTFYTTKKAGTGLGLSISRTIIENHGGKIWAENRLEGGAIIRFTLPLSDKPTQ